ncbi:BTAD domain-containing putative transcriptional regulator [Microbispora sp. KK1-11]|uniref:BTAD domain-containing putative transcriptional regulator n=1 Tax=Microbispora sp. KK1-11 TaxID=2053005 RepID=UPI001159A673|nr:BTAD domain-containing putative transcriptional regulator [Microbispora sp. KK1-11]TQS29021.1 AAA family ATPase [Microbispora sp. KK1-11]
MRTSIDGARLPAPRPGLDGRQGPALDFRLLGTLEVADGTGTILDLGPRKQRSVLALLLLNAPHVVPLDQLIDRLWRDEPPSSATGTLQAYISHLRRTLEPRRSPRSPARVLRTREPGYLLDIEPDQVDAERFGRAAEAAHAALAAGRPEEAERILGPALALWRGEPLADLADEPFARSTVARLSETRLHALTVRAEAWLAVGRAAEVTVEVERLLEQDPYREGLWALLMRALYRERRQAEALAAYQRCRTLLGDELGLDPSPELRRLEQAILVQDESLAGVWAPAVAVPPEPAPNARGGTGAGVRGGAAGEDTGDGNTGDENAGDAAVPGLVGREPHLRRIGERLDDLRRGVGGVFLVSGESGIGKTRLAEAAASMAAERGAAVAWSRCVEGSGAPAFWPWIQALNALAAAHAPTTQTPGTAQAIATAQTHAMDRAPATGPAPGTGEAGEAGGDLARLAHRLSDGDRTDTADPDTARFLLHDSVARALTRRASAAPVLVVVEDLHWADAASLKLLTFLGADLHRVPLLVLATVRPEPAVGRQALTEALGELTRQRGTERMTVAPLTPEQIADYLREAGWAGPGPVLASALHDRTGGNPFFLGELLRLLTSTHPDGRVGVADVLALAVPDGVRDVINQRVSRLPEDSQTLLRAAAVIGRDVDADVLETATGVGGARVMMLLEPAVATGLLVEVDGGWDYRFSHALVQEALYSGLSRRQRAQLHGRVGEAIETLRWGETASRLPALAHHFGLAARVGYADKAVSYAMEAAGQATARLAYDEAVLYWEQALDACAAGPAATRCALLIGLGKARRVTGDVEGARGALDEAVTLATGIGDDDAVIEAATVFGGVTLWNWRSYGVVDHRMVTVLEDQLSRLDPGAVRTRAELLGTLGVELYYGDRREEGRRHALEAVELARRTGDPLLLARTLNNFVIAAWTPEHEEERYRAAEEMLGLPGLPRATEIVARLHRMPRFMKAGMLADYDAELARCLRLTAEVRMPEIETQVAYAAAGRAMLAGDWAEMDRQAVIGTGSFRRTSLWGPDVLKLLYAFYADWCRGRPSPLLTELVEAAADDSNMIARPTAVLAALKAGDHELAHRLIDRWGAVRPRDWTWQFVAWQWALVAAELGRPDPHELLGELRPIAGELMTMGTGCLSWGTLHDVVARLLHRAGDVPAALAHAEAGRDAHRRLDLPHLVSRSEALLREIRAVAGNTGRTGDAPA